MKLQLKRNVKKALAFIVALFLSVTIVSAVIYSQVYWQRQITYTFETIGIDAELLEVGYEAFRTKKVATSLDSNNEVVLTIIAEQYYELYLNITWVCSVEGFDLTCTGQYLRYYWGTGSGVVETVGDPFECIGLNAVDKTKMMWADVGFQSGGPVGYGLKLHFNPNVEGVTKAGTHTVTITLQMGFTT
jgi:hypothetical protein